MQDCTSTCLTNHIYHISNYLPSRQGKSLDYEWVSVLDGVVFKASHRPFKQRTRLERYSYTPFFLLLVPIQRIVIKVPPLSKRAQKNARLEMRYSFAQTVAFLPPSLLAFLRILAVHRIRRTIRLFSHARA